MKLAFYLLLAGTIVSGAMALATAGQAAPDMAAIARAKAAGSKAAH